ncbi:MAG: hypothetical protein JSV89_18830 [Spirochaetaceae bacterium]|nr:MAG: hypothetical protein JSV89_18830 [Spirochaetaceae bacterium]
MSKEEPLYSILDYILNRATSAELEVIAEALQRRQSSGKGIGGISPRSMAENVAEKVRQQLEGMLDVHTISRQIVTDLIRQKEPNISDEELEVLLNNWLPGSARARDIKERSERPGPNGAPQAGEDRGVRPSGVRPSGQMRDRQGESVPPDVLITMVSQYVSARRGNLQQAEQDRLPKDWQSQYWESFPDHIRVRIRDHLNGRLDEVEFWDSIISSLGQ